MTSSARHDVPHAVLVIFAARSRKAGWCYATAMQPAMQPAMQNGQTALQRYCMSDRFWSEERVDMTLNGMLAISGFGP
jgi:hypothetical protein